jgi:flagellar biosynthesis regulator FlaF
METKVWTEDEIKDLILYAKEMQNVNEELRAKIIAMDAMLKNEMSKTKRLTQIIKLYEANN